MLHQQHQKSDSLITTTPQVCYIYVLAIALAWVENNNERKMRRNVQFFVLTTYCSKYIYHLYLPNPPITTAFFLIFFQSSKKP